MVTSGESETGRGKIGVGDEEIQTTMDTTDKQQGYIKQHRELQPLFYNNFKWSISSKNIDHYVVHLKLL